MKAQARVVAAHLCLLLVCPAAADESASLGDAEAAALAALRGAAGTARALLAGKGESDPAALVVLASLALEQGDLKEAARLAERLRGLRAEAAETRLLEALLAERRVRPHGGWLDAGLEALKTAHQLPETPPLLDLWARVQTLGDAATPLPEEATRKLSPADAFLVRWEWPRRQRESPPDLTAMAIKLAATDQRLAVHLAVLDVLRQPAGAQESPQRGAASRMVLEKLRQRYALLCLALHQHGEKDPVTEEEVTRFESAMAPDAAQLFAAQYSDLLDVFEKVDPAMAPGMAMGGAVASVVERYHPGPIGYRLALSPDLPEAARQRLGRALVRLAEATEREGLLLTTMLAASTLGVAAGLSPDDRLKARVEALRTEAYAMQDASRCLRPLLRLPIPSLQRAWAQQVAHERTFLYQRMFRRGLSCPEGAPGKADRP